jgi:hypothetical protein
MRVVLPSVEYRSHGGNLAPRPASLDGKVVGFIDGWGERHADGSFGMYPLMAALWPLLQAEHGARDYVWVKKPNISLPVEDALLADFLGRVDVVINGEAA